MSEYPKYDPTETLVGYCDDHGEFYFVGQSNGYCPVMVEKWGAPMRCNFRSRIAEPRTLAWASRQVKDALALLQEHTE